VTLLTSLAEAQLHQELKVSATTQDYVLHLAEQAQRCSIPGIVCSPWEVPMIRMACGSELLIVTPGIRASTGDHQDQQRVCTAREALAKGADYVVIGRMLTQHAQPVQALDALLQTLD